jgi:hypothetical protein
MELEKSIITTHGIFLIRPYRDDDEQKVLDLWELAFHKQLPAEVWRWKFHDNPFGRQIMLCMNEENMPVVMYSGIPFVANWQERDVYFTQLVDNMSHPDFRQATSGRKSLFIQTAEHFFDVYGGKQGSIFYYGFPGKKHFKLGNIFLNYGMIADGGQYLFADHIPIKSNNFPSFGKVRMINTVGNEFDVLWKAASRYYPFAIKRNSKFLQWRFCNHPTNHYQIYTYKNLTGKLLAYIVILINGPNAIIADVFSLPGKTPLFKIFQQIMAELMRNSSYQIEVWLPQKHFIYNYLIEIGFKPKPEPLGIITTGRSFCDNLNINYINDNIYYTMGDGDLF